MASNTEEHLVMSNWPKEATRVLQKVAFYKGGQRRGTEPSAWFRAPVDQSVVRDYAKKVKEPMDFSTIQEKLQNGQYELIEEFHQDMLLVRKNCFLYNVQTDPIAKDCTVVFDYYEQEYSRLIKRLEKKTDQDVTKVWDIGQFMRAKKNALEDVNLKLVSKEISKMDCSIAEKENLIHDLNADIEWRERLLGDITPVEISETGTQVALDPANQLFKVGQSGGSASKVKVPTSVIPNDTDSILLNPKTASNRLERTFRSLQSVHGHESRNVKDGLWHSLVNLSSPVELKNYVRNSKKCSRVIRQGRVSKKQVMQNRHTHANIVRSIKMLYKGGMVSSRKYCAVRLANKGVSTPELLTYKELKKEIDNIEVGLSAPTVKLHGCYRNIEATLLKLAGLYLGIDEVLLKLHGTGLDWFGKPRGEFCFAIGADGAPSGKFNTHTSLLLSIMNVLGKVGSCDHNYLLFGADVTEDDPLFISHLKRIVEEVEEIEKKEYTLGSLSVRFRLELVPADCKWAAIACGELSNAATYPSTFGNVHKDDLSTLNGSLGTGEKSKWKPWGYAQRLAHAKKVISLKTTVDNRAKVLQTIAGMQSRQEHLPVLGKYCEKVFVEPLHLKNNACQQLNKLVLFEFLKRTEEKLLKKPFHDAGFMASPIGQYLDCLKNKMKAGKFHIRLCRWLRETKINLSGGGTPDCTIRFTGEDSMKFCVGFPCLTKVLDETSDTPEKKFRQLRLHYAWTLLREAIGLWSKVKFSSGELEQLKYLCELYHAFHVLFFEKAALTTWHIGYAVPHHAELIYNKFGVGLGINTMQGREAKHQQIAMYAKFATPQDKWKCVFRHEYVQLYWLRENDMLAEAKEMARKHDNSKYHVHPTSAYTCGCGLVEREMECRYCDHPIIKLIEQSCCDRKVSPDLKKLLGYQ